MDPQRKIDEEVTGTDIIGILCVAAIIFGVGFWLGWNRRGTVGYFCESYASTGQCTSISGPGLSSYTIPSLPITNLGTPVSEFDQEDWNQEIDARVANLEEDNIEIHQEINSK